MFLRKIISKITTLAAITVCWALSGCSAEDISLAPAVDASIDFSGPKEIRYFSFRLGMADDTPYSRAVDDEKEEPKYGINDFVDRTPDSDSRVNNVLILFYDEDGKYLAHFDSKNMKSHNYKDDLKEESKEGTDTGDDGDEADDEGNEGSEEEENDTEIPVIEKIHWGTTVSVPMEIYNSVKDKKIHSFYALINYDEETRKKFIKTTKNSYKEEVETGISRKELLSTDLTTGSYMTNMGFLMTTPGYFKGNTYLHYALVDPQKTGEEVIFDSKEEAEKHPIDVYVERLAARVEMNQEIKNIEMIEVLYGTDVYGLTFTPKGWGLEGLENSGYITKHNQDIPDYNITNVYPTYFSDWINFTDKPNRTFWGESPNFLKEGQYDYAATGLELDEDAEGFYNGNLDLAYFKYEDISGNEFGKTAFYQSYFYTLEHTFLNSELKSDNTANPYAVPTSLVLAGTYEKAEYLRTDDIYKEESSPSPVTPGDLTFNESGFYLRHIDFERTDKDARDESGKSASKKYQYRLYREDNGFISDNSNLKNDLYVSLVKEQHIVFVKSETYHSYTNDAKDFIEEYNIEYVPVKENTTYYTIRPTTQEAKDEFGKIRKDKEGNPIYIKENVAHTISASDIFEINNSHRRWYNNKWVDASNTFTLQLRPNFHIALKAIFDLKNEALPELFYGIYPTETPTDGEVAEYKIIIEKNGNEIVNVNDEAVNKALQKQIGYAQFYYKGKAFFHSPLPHYKSAPPITEDSTVQPFRGVFSYEKKVSDNSDSQTTYTVTNLTGEFGIVRNHVYHFSVDGIRSLGYGIPGDNYIPLPEPIPGKDIYYFDLELKILPWNVFDMQIDI